MKMAASRLKRQNILELILRVFYPRPLVAAAFRLPHDGDLKVASTSTGQRGSLKAYKQITVIFQN